MILTDNDKYYFETPIEDAEEILEDAIKELENAKRNEKNNKEKK